MPVLIVVSRVNDKLGAFFIRKYWNSSKVVRVVFLWIVRCFWQKNTGRAAPQRRPSWGCTKTPMFNKTTSKIITTHFLYVHVFFVQQKAPAALHHTEDRADVHQNLNFQWNPLNNQWELLQMSCFPKSYVFLIKRAPTGLHHTEDRIGDAPKPPFSMECIENQKDPTISVETGISQLLRRLFPWILPCRGQA